jgi:hypothetical protein
LSASSGAHEEAVELMANRAVLDGRTRDEIAEAVIAREIRFGP